MLENVCPRCNQKTPTKAPLHLVTYAPGSSLSRFTTVRHDDRSALGLDVVAVVDDTMCKPEDDCVVCTALRRRIQSRVGR